MVELATIFAALVAIVITYDRMRKGSWESAWQGPLLVTVFLIPSWFEFPVRSVVVGTRLMFALFIISCFLFRPVRGYFRWTVYPADFAVAGLFTAMVIADLLARTIVPLQFVNLACRWIVPYLIGRVFIRTDHDLHRVLGLTCALGVGLSAVLLLEGLTRINLLAAVLGSPWRPPESIAYSLEEVRWGLKRSYAVQTHPIYMGLSIAMLLPFMLEAARRAKYGVGQAWWRYAPWLVLPGIVATGSRSAQLAVLAVYGAGLVYEYRGLRIPALVVLVAAVTGFVAFRQEVLDLLGRYAGEADPTRNMVIINGEQYEYSGTRHRDLLEIVYAEATGKAGWTGYGTLQTDLPIDPNVDERFVSIDNHYLKFYLQYGLIGVAAFMLMAVAAFGNLIPSLSGGHRLGLFAASLLGAGIAVLACLRGVWFAPDFGWIFLFSAGLCGAVETVRRNGSGQVTHG